MKTKICTKFGRCLTVLLPAVAAALLDPSAALAQPDWLQYQLIVGAIGGPSNPNYYSGLVQGTNLLTTSISIPEARDNAYANPSITYGWLQFNADCSVNNNPSDGNGYGSYFGNSVVSFQDTLTIISATLPAGTPVQVQITCVYNGSITPGVGSGWDSTSSSASVGLTVRENGMGSNPNTFNGTVGGANQTNTLSFIAQVTVGDNNLIIFPSITANGSVNNQDGAPFSGSVSASIASQTYVDLLTPGAGYTSASGTVYPTLLSAPPTLGIQPATNGVTLFWPVTSTVCRLQQNADLTTTNWVSNTVPINVVNGTNQVTFSPATGNLFFRLINP